MKIIDLFSGIGGAGLGIKRVFPKAIYKSVDIEEKYNSTYNKDVFSFDLKFYKQFDLIWASPPCQAYSPACCSRGFDYPKLLDQTIAFLDSIGKPYIVENVVGAVSDIRKYDIILRGWYFKNLRDIRRPRKFWINGFLLDKPNKYDKIFPYYRLISGGGGWIKEPDKVKRMTIEQVLERWDLPSGFSMKDYAQIVPPEYSEWLCNQFKKNRKKFGKWL